MSTNQLPDGAINGLRVGELSLDESTPALSSTTASNPSLLDTGEPTANPEVTADSPPPIMIHISINNTQGRARPQSPSTPEAAIPGATRTVTWGVEEGGRLDENLLMPTLDEESEPVDVPSGQDIHSGSQGDNLFQGEDNMGHGGRGRQSPQLMWYEGEEYYEEPFRHREPISPSLLLLPSPSTLPTITTGPAAPAIPRPPWHSSSMYWTRAQTRGMPTNEDEDDQNFELPGFVESFYSTANNAFSVFRPSRVTRPPAPSRSPVPAFLNAAGEIDLNLVPHAPRTDLPPPPPLTPLPRLREEPPATWFEGMSENSRCPVLSQPDYTVEYSFPCGHALCRWCYEQICLASDRPVCPLCRRRI